MTRSYQTWGYNPGRDITSELSREEEAQARHLLEQDEKRKNNVTANELFAYEQGELEYDECVQLFQKLVNSGLAWTLQGSYGRTAATLIDQGLITLPEEN